MKKLSLFLSVLVVAAIATTAFKSFDASPFATGVGVRTYVYQNVPDTSNASVTLANSHMSTPIAANQHVHLRYSIPFSLASASPGIKFQVTVPTGGTAYNVAGVIYSNAGTVVAVSDIVAQAAIGFTVAATGNHWATIEADIINGSTAGNVVLQFAQNVSNASNTILLRGAFADATKW